ncbi:endonuclease domain-containing protein [Nonomuraea sp. NPDC049400]|uniref:endonuclease domain-containing protein n=1 Tax=Nonomuraea sp. NPDC049400 TaxID=3364352 RepID=UPI003795748A
MIAWLGPQDMPEHRRALLLYRLAWEAQTDDPVALAALVAERVGRPCRVLGGTAKPGSSVAVLGDDSRYHLLLDGHYICSHPWPGRKKPPAGTLPHEQWCTWWTADEQSYRVNPPYGTELQEGVWGTLDVRWPVRPLEIEADPAAIRRRERCAASQDDGRWPPFQGKILGPIIRALIEALGPACHACGSRTGVFVDHNPDTLLVRALLCRHCNTWVETCPHPAGCVWGDYLNDPPTAFLGLTYPRAAISRKRRDGFPGR